MTAVLSDGSRRDLIARYWMIACLDRLCVNCGCGRSRELIGKGASDLDDYELTA